MHIMILGTVYYTKEPQHISSSSNCTLEVVLFPFDLGPLLCQCDP